MWKRLLLPALLFSVHAHAGWFDNKQDKTADLEREQRQRAEQRLQEAQKRMDVQSEKIERLHTMSSISTAAAVVLLIIGMALGAKTKRDGTRK